jgi:hypothetical protein
VVRNEVDGRERLAQRRHSIMHTSFRPRVHRLVPCSLVAFGFACTGQSEEETTTSDDFVIEDDDDDDDDDDDVSDSESADTTGEGDTTDADTSTDDADTSTDGSEQPDTCGNGLIDPGEECDGAALDGATCVSEGFDSGTLACSVNCNFDISECEISDLCGNGAIDGNEECDGANLGGASCQSEGFAFGELTCWANCSVNPNGCGNQTFEGFEGGAVPTGWTSGGTKPWVDHYGPNYNTTYMGDYSLTSGSITNNENSWVQVVVDFPGGGSIDFWHLISSETNNDFGIFAIDGVVQDQWSGYPAFEEYEMPVDAGEHTFRWTYQKDDYNTDNNDAWYLDDVTFVGGYLP